MNSFDDESVIILQDVMQEEKLPVIEVVETLLKNIEYHGLRIIIPSRFNYVASDEAGTLMAFINKPVLLNKSWIDENSTFTMKLMNAKQHVMDWTQSLTAV